VLAYDLGRASEQGGDVVLGDGLAGAHGARGLRAELRVPDV
jgi:hypothetical protein